MKHETTTTARRVSELLVELAEGLKCGRFAIGGDDGRIELQPSPAISVGLKIRRSGTKESLRLDLAWTRSAAPLEIITGGQAVAARDEATAENDDDDDAERDEAEVDDVEDEAVDVDEAEVDDVDEVDEVESGDAESNDEPLPLDSLSRERLYELARSAEIEGRSGMDKQQLVEALTPVISIADLNRDDREALAEVRDGGEEDRAARAG
jgi:amphi-Trp domain-containing protein